MKFYIKLITSVCDSFDILRVNTHQLNIFQLQTYIIDYKSITVLPTIQQKVTSFR